MLRSMYSAISGMQSFQTMLDVVGNNIANVDTPGFKSSSVDFADVLSQVSSGGSAPTAQLGGTNPIEVGLGVNVGAIQTKFTQGADQSTGSPTDLAINGQGLFVVSPDSGNHLYYTRAGDFLLDANDNLVLPNGSVAQGYAAGKLPTTPQASTTNLQPINLINMLPAYVASLSGTTDASGGTYGAYSTTTPTQITYTPKGGTAETLQFSLPTTPNVQIGPDGAITSSVIVTNTSATPHTTQTQQANLGSLALASFSNPSGLETVGSNQYIVSNNSGQPAYDIPGADNLGSVQAGFLEMSNVDLTQEMTNMIVAENAFAANSHMIGTDNTILNDIVNMYNS